jgi:hypothetical protein
MLPLSSLPIRAAIGPDGGFPARSDGKLGVTSARSTFEATRQGPSSGRLFRSPQRDMSRYERNRPIAARVSR